MKKLLSISLIPVLAFFLFGAFFAFPADAQAPTEKCTLVRDVSVRGFKISEGVEVEVGDTKISGDVASGSVKTSDWGTICLINTINTVVDWIFIFLIAIAVALIAIAGFLWMTAAGDPEKQGQARNMIVGAVIGIVIAILARLVPALITGVLL
jgi:hypothetical protein